MNKKEIIFGKLDAFFETGMEGVKWSLIDDEKHDNPYDAIHFISTGDHLTIYSSDFNSEIIFDSIIVETKNSNKFALPSLIGFQQSAGGFLCHSLPHGFDPELWASFFKKGCCAKLTKNFYSKKDIEYYINNTPCTDEKLTFQQKLLNQSSFFLHNKLPNLIYWNNIFLELSDQERNNMDLPFYNAQCFMLKLRSIKKYTDCKHVLILSESPINQKKNTLSFSSIDNIDIDKVVNKFNIITKTNYDFLPEDVLTRFQNDTHLLSDKDVKSISESHLKQHSYNLDVFNGFINEINSFKVFLNDKNYFAAIIDFS